MAKKRRQAAAPRTPAATSRESRVDLEVVEKSLLKMRAVYDQLGADVAGVPASLERTLLLHSLVALVVQNALMIAQGVSMAQIVLVVGTGVWMMRKSFVAMLLPHVALRGGSHSESYWRSSIFIFTLSGLGTWFYRTEVPLNTPQLVLLAIVLVLDVVSIYLMTSAKDRLTPGQIVFSAVETTFLVAGFSTCLNYKEGLIFDEKAFALTAATAFVHALVLLSAKYVVLHCFDSDANGSFVKMQQRGAKLMEGILQDIDQFEPEQLLLGTTKLILSTFVLFSWEMMSALLLSSTHVLWKLGQVRRKVLSRSAIRPRELSKHKIE